jgi:hypothetical protein
LALVLLPVYVAFVASSLPLQDILDAAMMLVPGPDLLANYREALASGTAGTNGQPVAAMMMNSLVMALALTFDTLSFWPSEVGVSRTSIGLFALVGISYSVKFLWSPVNDRMPIPLPTARVGAAAAGRWRSSRRWHWRSWPWA